MIQVLRERRRYCRRNTEWPRVPPLATRLSPLPFVTRKAEQGCMAIDIQQKRPVHTEIAHNVNEVVQIFFFSNVVALPRNVNFIEIKNYD